MTGPSAAERVLLELGISKPSEIDLEAVAYSLGAIVKFRPMDRCEATIVGNGRRAIIAVNSTSIAVRRRFSIGHEIGHWHLHRNRLLLCTSKEIGNSRLGRLDPERQADDFASDLILPDYLFRPLVAKLPRVLLTNVREIAGEFQASQTATVLKMAKSGRFPIVVVRDGIAGARWSIPSPVLPGWWRLRGDLDPETFAYGLLHRGSSEETRPRAIGADAWFDFRGCDRYEIKEQSFSTTPDEVITILTIPENGLG